jgi:hypothetical protein
MMYLSIGWLSDNGSIGFANKLSASRNINTIKRIKKIYRPAESSLPFLLPLKHALPCTAATP